MAGSPLAITRIVLALLLVAPALCADDGDAEPHTADLHFVTADRCMACHNGIVTSEGQDLSFGVDWRASMMANSARDPYWHAAVRREVLDHPESQAAIENECSRCHMPMANVPARASGGLGAVFAHLPVGAGESGDSRFAVDGVSCAVCHRIEPDGLGSDESFTGGFEIDLTALTSGASRPVFGPFEIEDGHKRIMSSAVDFEPMPGDHIRSSELCATCHTLITHSLGPGGEVIGELPEQVPYLEWQHSAFREEKSCQSCHMPTVDESPISSVLGEPREKVARHVFRGGNFFMLRMLARYRGDLGVTALPGELETAAQRTVDHLAEQSAELEIEQTRLVNGRLEMTLRVTNLAGHKLPTAYPSRRAWLHVVVRDAADRALFESGAVNANASIVGNDNDADPSAFESHYDIIERADQVQVYEAVLSDPQGAVTTGLLTATQYAKDNRLLPRGFDKNTADEHIEVHGRAAADADFAGGGDRVRYRIDLGGTSGPYRIEAELLYQPIGYRWAENLKDYTAAAEPERFVGYYREMAEGSSTPLARTAILVP